MWVICWGTFVRPFEIPKSFRYYSSHDHKRGVHKLIHILKAKKQHLTESSLKEKKYIDYTNFFVKSKNQPHIIYSKKQEHAKTSQFFM